jgi:hypothetical protein
VDPVNKDRHGLALSGYDPVAYFTAQGLQNRAGAFFGTESLVPLTLTVQHGFGALSAGLPLVITCSGVS